jgi:predicted dienelactone hydrolase
MRPVLGTLLAVLIAAVLLSCGAPATVPPTTTPAQATANIPQVSEEVAATEATPEPDLFPLSEPGPYYVGKRTYTFKDASRDGRQVRVTIYYPALRPEGSTGTQLLAGTDRDPDLSSAPYPLILTGENSGNTIFKTHLATHGFVMAVIRHPDHYDDLNLQVVDHPRDFLFALDQIASQPLAGLEGIADTDRAGVTGYSWDGFISLLVSGARIDPGYYLAHCEQAPALHAAVPWQGYTAYYCNLAEKWAEFVAHAGPELTASEDGLWLALTDERIRAVLPMAPDGAWLYGERGLAAADRPMLIIAPTGDEYTPYQFETVFIFEHAGSPELCLISFVGRSHMMPFDVTVATRLNHFATAFFGVYLQGKSEYRDYFSEAFVSQFDDLAWGEYEGD